MPPSSKTKASAAVTVNFSDSISLDRRHVDWTPKGVRLHTKWAFAEGTEVEFSFDSKGERHCCVGVVVGCRPLPEASGRYETVLFFTEEPCTKLQKAACDCRLAPEGHVPPVEEPNFTLSSHESSRSRPR
jgi:hypothetical protein